MARRHRSASPGPQAPTGGAPVDPDVALFAARVQQQQERERADKRAAREERHRAGEHERLLAAKDAAAAEVKRLRQRSHGSAEAVATADAAYRHALAALLTHETGQAPAWAPAAPEPPATDDPAPVDEAARADSDAAAEPVVDGEPQAGRSTP